MLSVQQVVHLENVEKWLELSNNDAVTSLETYDHMEAGRRQPGGAETGFNGQNQVFGDLE